MTTLDELAHRARSLVLGERRALLGVTGEPGSGKSTFAQHLVALLRRTPLPSLDWVAYVPMDGFHLADVELDRLGRRDRKGAPDTFDAAGYTALLRRLHQDADEVVYAPAFERDLEQPIAGSIPIPPAARLIVTEGNYLLLDQGDWARVGEQLDEVWYCELARDERVARLIARHKLFGKDHDTAVAWVLGTDQRNADLIATTRSRADLIVPEEVLRSIDDPDRAMIDQP
ncbi:nucleoside/nucleotide kinase family protein [Nonomuraea sediminis]|uniref:nucleoside/nucleotide kinase family protein n=1 Tax=Nonomuraea sediminis TaxID=2835864 RepID=UPI001BDC0A51|nr:nucleoside/nucleotide kinase family protein [Nonomuraea sediminis]